MYVPAAYAFGQRDMHVARVFFYSATLFLILTGMIGLATSANPNRFPTRSHLLALVGAFLLLPVMLAVPFHQAVGNTSFLNAYFEMVSSLTTTGATLFDPPDRLHEAVHLWRALVGWLGGFLVWVIAIAILAPLNLGGFELTSTGAVVGRSRVSQISRVVGSADRLLRYTRQLFPIYAGLTLVLWVGLTMAGERAFVAASHAMATLATSGISPIHGVADGDSGLTGEILIFAFLFFAVSRHMFLFDQGKNQGRILFADPEFRMSLLAVFVLPALLFLRHWLGAYEVDEEQNVMAALHAFWGSVFTVLSFLTTTGFESYDWGNVRGWSGLETPGLLLVGLALVGGGVGTTAGGIRLLRVFALYRHGVREIERLVHPSSVSGNHGGERYIRRDASYIAWVVFSVFALSIAVFMILLSLTGLDFQSSSVFAISAVTTTGPLARVAADAPLSYGDLGSGAKIILVFAMVLGRLGTLSIIALLNPDLWRR